MRSHRVAPLDLNGCSFPLVAMLKKNEAKILLYRLWQSQALDYLNIKRVCVRERVCTVNKNTNSYMPKAEPTASFAKTRRERDRERHIETDRETDRERQSIVGTTLCCLFWSCCKRIVLQKNKNNSKPTPYFSTYNDGCLDPTEQRTAPFYQMTMLQQYIIPEETFLQ